MTLLIVLLLRDPCPMLFAELLAILQSLHEMISLF